MNKEKLEKELAEAKSDLAALKKMGASADEIEFQESEVKDIEEKLKSASSEKKSEPVKKGAVSVRTSSKEEVKKPAAKVESSEKKSEAIRALRGGKKHRIVKPARVETRGRKPNSAKPIIVKDEKRIETRGRKPSLTPKVPVKKSKGLSVVYDGKTYLDTDKNFCEILIKQLEERKIKRKETGGKVKTHSLSAKVGDNIASSVVTAIKGAFKENRDEILDNKTSANKFLKTVDKIEAAADKFVKEMKAILTDSFKQKDFDKEFKEVDEVIKKIKDTIKKSSN